MKLYEIGVEIRQVIEQSETGELTPEVLGQLESLEMALNDKVDAYCVLMAEADYRVAARTAEIDRLKAANQTDSNAKDRLKANLLNGLQIAETRRVETVRFKVWIQTSQPSIVVDIPAEDLPAEFWRTSIEANKTKLKEVLDAGGALPEGVRQVDGKEYLRIK